MPNEAPVTAPENSEAKVSLGAVEGYVDSLVEGMEGSDKTVFDAEKFLFQTAEALEEQYPDLDRADIEDQARPLMIGAFRDAAQKLQHKAEEYRESHGVTGDESDTEPQHVERRQTLEKMEDRAAAFVAAARELAAPPAEEKHDVAA